MLGRLSDITEDAGSDKSRSEGSPDVPDICRSKCWGGGAGCLNPRSVREPGGLDSVIPIFSRDVVMSAAVFYLSNFFIVLFV